MQAKAEVTLPRLPLPAVLRGTDPEWFPQHTLSIRLPGIARRVLEESRWPPQVAANLAALADEMPAGRLRPLQDSSAPDALDWERDLAPYLGQTWNEAPWFVAEIYFFRRILEATGYYQPGPGRGVDPYIPQKRQEQVEVCSALHTVCVQLEAFYNHNSAGQVEVASSRQMSRKEEFLAHLLRTNLWGNQADRSMWPVGASQPSDGLTADQRSDFLLVDQSDAASHYLAQPEKFPPRVDIILDNVGIELAYDLALVDFLLAERIAQVIHLHAKPHPTYVSDVTIQDIHELVEYLESSPEPPVHRLAKRLRTYLIDGKLCLQTNFFWTSPLSGWQMPPALCQELSQSHLIISKGDANYRRWLGDRHWPYTTSLADILSYRPAPVLALRVVKSNLMAGLQPGQADAVQKKDPHWLHSGQWGMIQFIL
jgi:hypothetical protein